MWRGGIRARSFWQLFKWRIALLIAIYKRPGNYLKHYVQKILPEYIRKMDSL